LAGRIIIIIIIIIVNSFVQAASGVVSITFDYNCPMAELIRSCLFIPIYFVPIIEHAIPIFLINTMSEFTNH